MKVLISLDKFGFDNDYVRSLEAAGVRRDEIVLVPSEPAPARQAAAEADGLLLGGGEDVEPVHYGETPRFANVEWNAARDRRELAIYEEARRLGLPLLAICRGLQLVNVARGGTLIQDIPSEVPGSTLRHQVKRKDEEAHLVQISAGAPGVELATCFGGLTAAVNSRHHQAAASIAPDLVIAGVAPDGVVEAVSERSPSHRFFIAVQWHPENMPTSSGHGELFRRFVAACREGAARRLGTMEEIHR